MVKGWFCCPPVKTHVGQDSDDDDDDAGRNRNSLIDGNQITEFNKALDDNNIGDAAADDDNKNPPRKAMNQGIGGDTDEEKFEVQDSKMTSEISVKKPELSNIDRVRKKSSTEIDLPESNHYPVSNLEADLEGEKGVDEGSMNLNEIYSESEESLSDFDCGNASLAGEELFEIQPQIPRPKKQFLEAALTAKSLSDLNYVHGAQDTTGSRWKSMTDLKYEHDNESLDDDELFELDAAILRPKKLFLEAALAAKSMSDLNFVLTVQVPTPSRNHNKNTDRSINSLDDFDLFEDELAVPPPKKQFLEAAITARSLSDLNYVHLTQEPKSSRRKSLTDLKYRDDGSLGHDCDEVFELEAAIPRPKKQFLEAALAAKSMSDLNYFAAQPAKESKILDRADSKNSLDDIDLFEDDMQIPRPKKQFLEAAIMAKSLSDLNYVHAAEVPNTSRRKSMTDFMYGDDNSSLGDDEVFELEASIPRPKKQFLEAALTAKSISDLNFVHTTQSQDDSISLELQGSNDSLDDLGLFDDMPAVPRPKKQFLEAAIMAKSLSDLNYVYSDPGAKDVRWKSLTDLKYDDDSSLGDDEVFQLELSIPRPKKQFLEAALAAKSISDLNFVHAAQSPDDDSISLGYQCSNDSLDDVDIFEEGVPIPKPKKQFLEAAMMAKSLSDLNYVYSAQAPQDSRWKSLTDLKYDDDSSLEDDEVFELELSIPRPKKQFLEAALTAKSISDLNFFVAHTPDTSINQDDGSTDSLDDFELYENDLRVPRPKKQFLEAAMMAKSLSDLNYIHSVQEPKASRRKSLTDLNDDDSLGDDELFELHPSVPRPRKQFLEAALMAKSLSDLKFMRLGNMTTISSLKDNESRDDYTLKVVPEHLLRLSQPNLNFHPADIHSIDNEDLFESVPEDPPIERPILKAALEAKAQQAEGIIIVNNRHEPNLSNSDDQSKIVPEHLVIANQPATVHSHDNYSIDVEDVFEQLSDDQNAQKPLLKAARDAHAQRQEIFAKSISCFQAVNQSADSSSAYKDFSKSVPDHLAIANQPSTGLPTLDELSIDNDRLFDTPKKQSKKTLLMAALKAKEETKQMTSPFTKNDLKFLKELEQIRGGKKGNKTDESNEAENIDQSK